MPTKDIINKEASGSVRGAGDPYPNGVDTNFDWGKQLYQDKVMRSQSTSSMEKNVIMDDGEVSDNDIIDRKEGGPWFNMGMSRKENIKARKSWRSNATIKLIRKKIRY